MFPVPKIQSRIFITFATGSFLGKFLGIRVYIYEHFCLSLLDNLWWLWEEPTKSFMLFSGEIYAFSNKLPHLGSSPSRFPQKNHQSRRRNSFLIFFPLFFVAKFHVRFPSFYFKKIANFFQISALMRPPVLILLVLVSGVISCQSGCKCPTKTTAVCKGT